MARAQAASPPAAEAPRQAADLRLSGVAKSFGRVRALDGLDLEVRAGEFFVILGPSAAGKTTTLRTIAGLEKADAGRLLFAGRDLADQPIQGRGIAMIFQTFALYPHLTVRANLGYPLKQQGVAGSEIRRRVDEIAAMLRIGHTLERRPGTLSGGEQQRLAIGRALIQRPRLLLLDEPLTNLDAKLRHDTRAEFKRLHRELGMTMLYATPDQLEALSMGERIAVLREGKVVQTGTPDELYERPVDSYVATMVGAPPMNLVQGEIGAGAQGRVLRLPMGEVALGAAGTGRWPELPAGPALFGMRPHDLAPLDAAAGAEEPGFSFTAEVHLVEPLGDVTILDLISGEVVLKIALPEEEALAYPAGTRLRVGGALRDAHLFTAAGQALAPAARPG